MIGCTIGTRIRDLDVLAAPQGPGPRPGPLGQAGAGLWTLGRWPMFLKRRYVFKSERDVFTKHVDDIIVNIKALCFT